MASSEGTRGRLPLAVMLAVGVALRVVALANRPSIGLDEARLALNIASRSYGALAQPLAHDQSAPLLFLWIEKFATQLFGVSDVTLRIVPAIAGIGTLLLVFPVFRKVLGDTATLIATAIVACSPVLVYYAGGVKQYGVEVCVSLLLLALASAWLEAPRDRVPKGWLLLVAGTLAVWASAPAIFVLAAVVLGVGWTAVRDRDRMRLQWLGGAAVVWLASFGAAYLLVYRPASENAYLRHYWNPAFLSHGHMLTRIWAVAREAIWGIVIGYPGTPGWSGGRVFVAVLAAAACGAMIWGGRSLARRYGPALAIVVAGPIVIAVGASIAGLYPLVFRLLLFATPFLVLLLLAGLESGVAKLGPRVRRVAWLATGVALAGPLLVVSFLEVTSGNPPEHVRAMTNDLARRRGAGEPVYIFAGTIPAWAFYSTDWSNPDRKRLDFLTRIAQAGGPAFENAPGRTRPVAVEGNNLIYHAATGPELYGISTGIEWLPSGGVTKRMPDAGWAENEATRIETAAAPGVWVMMSHVVGGEVALLQELERRGARRTYVLDGNDSYLARYVFSQSSDPAPTTFGRRSVTTSAGK